MVTYKGYTIPEVMDPPPWGEVDIQIYKDFADKVGSRELTPCSHEGHRHTTLYKDGSDEVGIAVQNDGSVFIKNILLPATNDAPPNPPEGQVVMYVNSVTNCLNIKYSNGYIYEIPMNPIAGGAV